MARVYKRKKNGRWDGNYWIDFVDANGKRQRRKIGPNQRIAKEVLNGYLGQVARRQHLGTIEDSPISFADFVKEWWKRIAHTLSPRTQERWIQIAEQHLQPAFRLPLRSITAAMAEAYVANRVAADASASSVNREMTVLKHIMRRAVSWEYLSRNPFLDAQGQIKDGLRPLKEPPGRTRYLKFDEIDRLLDACAESKSPYLRPFVVVALNTGMRRNEILSLTRGAIDWQNRTAHLTDTKNGDARDVHLNDAALDGLKALPARLDGRLFPMGPNQLSMLFRRAVKRAQLEDLRLHDCRHTFASYQAMAGVRQPGLQALLGHRDGRMTARYTHLSEDYLKAAVNAVNLGTGQRAEQVNERDLAKEA